MREKGYNLSIKNSEKSNEVIQRLSQEEKRNQIDSNVRKKKQIMKYCVLLLFLYFSYFLIIIAFLRYQQNMRLMGRPRTKFWNLFI